MLIVIDIPVVRIREQIGEDYISPVEEYWRAASRDMGYWELENVHASCAEIRQVCIRISYIISNDIFADNEICARFTVVEI